MERFRKFNIIFGWLSFSAALLVYMLTLQPSNSFWDCGEFIATAFKLQVGHQPGAPMFMMVARVFSLAAADPSQVAFWVNTFSAVASALTVMFLFWTITALACRLVKNDDSAFLQISSIIGAGLVGALGYAFSDSFWFSAVEAEVYAVSSLCTAVVFLAALKWDASDEPDKNKWLVFIAYLIGLSIGIHLLSLLAIPAIVLLWYFKQGQVSKTKMMLALLAGCIILGFVQFGVVQYLLSAAFNFDLFFVNTLNLGFGSGALFFCLLVVLSLGLAIHYSHRKHKPGLNLALICISFIIFGYSSYSMIVIRAVAKTSINISNPDNTWSLLRYVSRGQYSQAPLLYGQYFDAQSTGVKEGTTTWRKDAGKYGKSGANREYEFDRNTIFPRIYSDEPADGAFYRSWLGLAEDEKPGFADNIRFFSSYQVGFMYMRYFLWNFAGRQEDMQGYGDHENGNWLTGIGSLDRLRLGEAAEVSPLASQNEGYNRFYGLPLLLGVCGLVYHFRMRRKDATVVMVLFFFTGLAIVLYLNQDPMQVRERDYAYVGSFYAFAVWIGLGAFALQQWLGKIAPASVAGILAFAISFAAAPYIMIREGWNDHNRSGNYVAHDMAVNFLESCAANAILFTNADNDTYPLWYVQEVEGVRPDVRIVNLQLLFDPDYVTALKKKSKASAPLPVTMEQEKYKAGVRDVTYYVDYGLTDSVELRDIFELLVSDHEEDKITLNDGARANFLPSKKFRITVNPSDLLKTGTLTKEEIPDIEKTMEWTYNKNYVSRSELALMDILVNNNWKRPVYFTTGLSADTYFGLDRYLHLEGYAYRLLPLKRNLEDKRDKSEITRSGVFYSNLQNKLKFDSFKTTYLDPESRRMAQQTWNLVNTLAANLAAANKTKEAADVMDIAVKTLPLRNYTIRDSVEKYRAAVTLYRLNEIDKANALTDHTVKFLGAELKFLTSLGADARQVRMDDIRLAASILQGFKEEAAKYKQPAMLASIDEILNGSLGL